MTGYVLAAISAEQNVALSCQKPGRAMLHLLIPSHTTSTRTFTRTPSS